jgi:hypothetical protein
MNFEFDGKVWFWKGPAPWYFVTVPEKACAEIKGMSSFLTYGWGMIPATVRIGRTKYKTALWPKDGAYIVPIKADVRKAEKINEGDTITVRLDV